MRAWERPDRRWLGDAHGASYRPRPAAWLLPCLVAFVLSLSSGTGAAEDRIAVSRAAIEVRHGTDPGTFVDAQFALQLPASLRDAVDHGIALYFVIELEISRHRWYWFDRRVLDDSIQYRLSFSPLTRQYRLSRGGLALPFDTLDQALATMRRVVQWRVADAELLDDDKAQARIRLRLDTSMLPKPFQVNALTDRDWTLTSDWASLGIARDSAE
jgi:hypothetical protein